MILRGKLLCNTGLHIGTGELAAPGASDLPVTKDAVGHPFVPGSSLKGVLRSFAERIVSSLTTVTYPTDSNFQKRFTSCLLHTDSYCCLSTCKSYQKDFSRKQERGEFANDGIMTDWILKHTCSVCQLFGSPYLASRVWIKDAFAANEPLPIEVRNGVAIDRDRRAAAAHLLFDLEVVPPTSAFNTEVRVENASFAELGLLFLVLDKLNDGELRLGGRGSVGLGQVKFERGRIVYMGGDVTVFRAQLLNHLLGRGAELTKDDARTLWESCKDAFSQKIREGWSHA